jgi:AcrR family transcriptional regulator
VVTEQPLDIREQIVDAAERIIVDRGFTAATTRAIAETARCAEGSIYRYFPHKNALFVEVVKRRYPEFTNLLAALPDRVGKGSVQRTLDELVRAALEFYRMILPVVAGTLTERTLLEAQREHFHKSGSGPAHSIDAVADYLRQEQRLGRLSPKTSPVHASRMLLGAPFAQAFLEQMLGPAASIGADEEYARDIVKCLMEGMANRTSQARVPPTVEARR